MMENKNDSQIDISSQVLEKVKRGEIRICPRWKYAAAQLGQELGIAVFFAIAVFVFSMLLHYWRFNDLPGIFGFGYPGVWHILHFFPYELLAAAALLITMIIIIARRSGRGYKISRFGWMAISLAAITVLSGAMMLSGINERMEATIMRSQIQPLHFYYAQNLHNIQDNVLVGRVVMVRDEELELSAASSSYYFKLPSIRIKSRSYSPAVGDRIRMVGHWDQEGSYQAWGMELIEDKPWN